MELHALGPPAVLARRNRQGRSSWRGDDMKDRTHFLPMTTAGTQHFIERTYRESGIFQWVRETWKNAEEAEATRIQFGVEWQAVESLGVYRRLIADNGHGMNAEQLQAFFNTFGGGGKPIGGAHENFGVGSKTSLLPWNPHGVVVISWVDGDPSMIWVQRNTETGEYGLRVLPAEDPETGDVSLEAVYAPFDDPESGCDWRLVKPDIVERCGTVMVLLGTDVRSDTVLGDPHRAEDDIKGISAYLNKRVWEIPTGVEISVDELRTAERQGWPRTEREAHGPAGRGIDRRTNRRAIRGARYFIEYPERNFKQGKLLSSGTVALSDGTDVDWYLWSKERPAVHSYASMYGYIGALYKNELFDIVSHMATYRSFGISEKVVRERVWLVARPPHFDAETQHGVYPRTDRNALLIRGGPNAGQPLPWSDWAAEFAEQMPDEIRDAIRDARVGQEGTISDESWRERLADRFGARWRILRLRLSPRGRFTTSERQPGTSARPVTSKKKIERGTPATSGPNTGGRGGQLSLGVGGGGAPARQVRVAGGIPTYRPERAANLEEGMLAAWVPNDPEHPEGVVLINTEHPVLEGVVQYWQSKYPDQHAEAIANDIVDVYGQIAVAKVAHSEHLKGILPATTIERDLRSSAALTMALLGLVSEEAVLATRIGGKYGRSRTMA